MSTIDKKNVINLPGISWRSFFTLRFALIFSLLLSALGFSYWYKTVRPYFWITNAHVETHLFPISSHLEGRIVTMNFLEGEKVKRDQTVFTIDNDFITTRRTKVNENIFHLKKQIQSEKNEIGKAMEKYLVASEAYEIGLGSQETVKKQLSLMDEAQLKVETASTELKLAQDELLSIDTEAKKLSIISPFDGIVIKKKKELGSFISLGEPVYILCNPNQIWLEAQIPEEKIGQINVGAPVDICLSAFPRQKWKGKVSWIAPVTLAKSLQLPFSGKDEVVSVQVSLDSPDPILKPGLSAQMGFKID